ncbi:FAD-binding oxidoreductase [Neorhizobium galegae]|uniref:D-lactate dehydrogenase (cytochrome) n=1 Tax=Neorhizobium galegae bv. orientalis str. HAMBI 540 TaxID=1028800 RepID=A0A068SYG9_NEOGA|nr:FAD-linked oxidase C-terminal domain-containing protein [Neorhizobium galegae]CDN50864.1 Putative D-lactate dehydrogenase (D-lactate ferricytochrome C oxidoreductase) [Neorhizobium galegae bv. orientalis str. HAMBI 540]CDZ43737.1 Putative D-lactate dehydrogenase (D-lactate ferricytochrome C oxidoreductase) [Neorhizobium galegae bv. orientalis]
MTSLQSTLDALKLHFGDRLSTTEAVREHHGHDMSRQPTRLPDAVVYAENEDEVARVVSACFEAGIPVTPFAAGSSMEGHTIPLKGGISLDLTRMNRIVQVNHEDFDVQVEAGVTRKQLNAHIRDTGLFFPIDPGADASLGGMASTRASGTTAVRYGTMRENVLALRVVTPQGKIITTGRRTKKSSTGYDLTKLYVGAEGTLGVITEVTVRLHPIPETIASAVCAFETMRGAVETVVATIQSGIPVARIEFLDEVAVEAANRHAGLTLKLAPTLFLEFHGSPRWVEEQSNTVREIANEFGGSDFEWSTRTEDRERLWKARHETIYSNQTLRPGCKAFTTDVCVPISRLAEAVLAAREDIDNSFVTGKIIGHVGDGNFHVGYLIKPEIPEELAEAERLAERLYQRAMDMGGTFSGEHGIGISKLKYLRREHGDAVDMMNAIKAAIDPKGIMNPGKLGQVE